MTDSTKETWKWRIEMRQQALGVTTGQVAEAAEMGSSTYRTIVNADNATTRSLEAIERALGVPAGWLMKAAPREELAREAAAFPAPAWLTKGDDGNGPNAAQ